MDEISFRLSNQLEMLQICDKIQASVALQRGQQWITMVLTQCQRYIHELCSEERIAYLKHIGYQLLELLEDAWRLLQTQYYSTYLSTMHFYQQLMTLCSNEVTRREVIFCLTGLSIGTLIGYYIGRNWGYYSRHMHRMRAVICHHYIGIEGVSAVDDAEMPMIQKSNDLLIQVRATSVNIVDTKICHGYSKVYRRLLNSGKYKDIPVTLGRDCTGVVVDIGQNVINFDIGDEVFLAVPSWASGTMAEYIVVAETQVVKRPKRCTFETSASIPYNGCLAWDALVNRSVIKEGNAKGKRVLVYGGNSPSGCILIQLVKLWGGYVVTTCKSNAVPVMRALGADEVISLHEVNIEKELEPHDKFNAIFYTGGQLSEPQKLRKYLEPHGSYASTMPEYLLSDSLGFISGSIFAGCVRMRLLIQYIFGFNMYQWTEGSKINVEYLQALSDLADADELQPVVDRVYAPHNIDDALHHILDPEAIGSTIIKFQ